MRGYVKLTYKFRKEGRKWTAHCEELGTATFGPTLLEAQKRIVEATLLHLNTLEDVGERKRFFKENGIKLYLTKPKTKQIRANLPLDRMTFMQSDIQPIGRRDFLFK